MRSKYIDLLYLHRPVSAKHRPMTQSNRAAQFAPFAALTGYEQAVNEAARWTESQIFLSEDQISVINHELNLLKQRPSSEAEIVYFAPDSKKKGGHYLHIRSKVKKIDELYHQMILLDGTVIPLKQIVTLKVL